MNTVVQPPLPFNNADGLPMRERVSLDDEEAAAHRMFLSGHMSPSKHRQAMQQTGTVAGHLGSSPGLVASTPGVSGPLRPHIRGGGGGGGGGRGATGARESHEDLYDERPPCSRTRTSNSWSRFIAARAAEQQMFRA